MNGRRLSLHLLIAIDTHYILIRLTEYRPQYLCNSQKKRLKRYFNTQNSWRIGLSFVLLQASLYSMQWWGTAI